MALFIAYKIRSTRDYYPLWVGIKEKGSDFTARTFYLSSFAGITRIRFNGYVLRLIELTTP